MSHNSTVHVKHAVCLDAVEAYAAALAAATMLMPAVVSSPPATDVDFEDPSCEATFLKVQWHEANTPE